MIFKNFTSIKNFTAIKTTVAAPVCHTILDGTNENVNANGVVSSVSANNTGSWSCWVKPVDATPSGFECLMSFGDTNANEYLTILNRASGELQMIAVITASVKFNIKTTNVVFANDTWAHVCFVQNGTSPKVYIDGVDQALTLITSTDLTVWNNDYSGLDNFNIGVENIISTNYYHYNGGIDEVFVSSTAFNQTQVTAIYDEGRTNPNYSGVSGVVSHWKMDTLNPVDEVGSNNGTSINQDASNIICV